METAAFVVTFYLFGVFLIIIGDELRELIVKILIPSLIGISIKLALKIREGRLSFFNACTSVVIGIGFAYLFGGIVLSYFSERWAPAIIAAITMTGEKIAYWVIYRFDFDVIGDAFIERLKNWIIKK